MKQTVLSSKITFSIFCVFLDAFVPYNPNKRGRGVCIIFTLFTGDLRAYVADLKRAFDFFKDTLGYDVFADASMRNCSQTELKRNIRLIQTYIRGEEAEGRPFDSLVFIIMSHGLKVCERIPKYN